MLAKCFSLWCFQNLVQLLKNRRMSRLQLSLWQFLNQRAESKILKHYWQISLKSYLLDSDRGISWWSRVSWFGTSHPMNLMMHCFHLRSHCQPVDPAWWLWRRITKFSLCTLGSSWTHYQLEPFAPRRPKSCCLFPEWSWPVSGWCWRLACKVWRACFQLS